MKRKGAAILLGAICILGAAKGCAPDRATWYGDSHRGHLMANGKRFNPDALTAASWDYSLGTKLSISHSNKSVVVEVTDRGGAKGFFQLGKTIDLSRAAFGQLASTRSGSITVQIKRVK